MSTHNANRMPRSAMIAVIALILLPAAAGMRLGAATVEELASEVGRDRGQDWQRIFAAELEATGSEAHISAAAYEVVLRAFAGESVSESPEAAAQLIFAVSLRADRELRRGVPPAQVAFETRRSVGVALRSGGKAGVRESAQYRVRRQLSGMGPEILGDMEERPGPQSGGGTGIGPAYGGGASQTGSHTASGGTGSGKTSK